MSAIIDCVSALAGEMFDIGRTLVDFVTTYPVCLVGVGLYILVALMGGIRRLIPGV